LDDPPARENSNSAEALEAMSRLCKTEKRFVAAFYDAYRGQLFGALFTSLHGRRSLIGDEMVISPQHFLEYVSQNARDEPVSWISLDPKMITGMEGWKKRERVGDLMRCSDPVLAPVIGLIAQEKATRGEFIGPLQLDANYVRRSDAELFWKGPAGNAR
jgi:tRNA A37 threonylcarbamoyladenosine modification protein TsaB